MVHKDSPSFSSELISRVAGERKHVSMGMSRLLILCKVIMNMHTSQLRTVYSQFALEGTVKIPITKAPSLQLCKGFFGGISFG